MKPSLTGFTGFTLHRSYIKTAVQEYAPPSLFITARINREKLKLETRTREGRELNSEQRTDLVTLTTLLSTATNFSLRYGKMDCFTLRGVQ